MSKRVSPTDRLRAEVEELFGSGRDLAAILEDVARVSVRLMMQTALEAEVDAFLGRARYQRRDPKGPAGSRNGWQPPTTVHATMGDVQLQRPKLRHRSGVLLPTVRRRGDQDQRAGVAGDLGLGAWAVRP